MNERIGFDAMKEIGLRIRDADLEAERLQQRAAGEATTLGDVLASARRQAVPLFVSVLIGLLIGLVHYATTPKQYYASATVLVDDRRSEIDQQVTASIPFARNDTSFLNEIQVLKSLQLATEVVRRTDLQNSDLFLFPPSSLARNIVSGIMGLVRSEDPVPTLTAEQQQEARILGAASKLQGNIIIERIGLSFSINIAYIGHDPELASQIVNTYAEAYHADHVNANVESTEQTAEWRVRRLAELEHRAAEIQAEAAALRQSDPTQVAQLRQLAQRESTLNSLYQTIAARYQEVSIQGSFPVTNGRILTRSPVPKNPALPKLSRTLAVAILLSLMLGFAIAVLREMREQAFRVSTEVYNHTGKSFLGHLPRIDLKNLSDRPPPETSAIVLNEQTHSGGSPEGDDAAPSDASSMEAEWQEAKTLSPELFWSVLMPQSTFSGTLRNIHSTIGLESGDSLCNVVAFTSMLPDEGKTTVAMNYANMLAKSGARVLLMDADIRGSGLSTSLRLPESPGVVDVLRGRAPLPDAIHVLPFTNLHILLPGPDREQSVAGDILYQQNARALMAELRNHYDCIVLDMPPLGKSAEAKAMIAHIDQIVLVCDWGRTPRSLVTQYLAHESEIAKKIIGVALNRVDIQKLSKYARPGWPESYTEADSTLV